MHKQIVLDCLAAFAAAHATKTETAEERQQRRDAILRYGHIFAEAFQGRS